MGIVKWAVFVRQLIPGYMYLDLWQIIQTKIG